MGFHQAIQFQRCSFIDCFVLFPKKDCLPPSFPQPAQCFYGPERTERLSPFLLKSLCMFRAKQTCSLEPPQERTEVRKQFYRLAHLERACIQKIERQMVSQKKKSIPPL